VLVERWGWDTLDRQGKGDEFLCLHGSGLSHSLPQCV
jgi:hypothetical protein